MNNVTEDEVNSKKNFIIDIGATETTGMNQWSMPNRVSVDEVGETIEMIYKQTSMLVYTTYPSSDPEERVFKIVYSCKNGKWHKSEPIYGTTMLATEEYYEFN